MPHSLLERRGRVLQVSLACGSCLTSLLCLLCRCPGAGKWVEGDPDSRHSFKGEPSHLLAVPAQEPHLAEPLGLACTQHCRGCVAASKANAGSFARHRASCCLAF